MFASRNTRFIVGMGSASISYDHIAVGAGTAACVLAVRLSENPEHTSARRGRGTVRLTAAANTSETAHGIAECTADLITSA
jgi:hypothetical protein